MKEASIRIRGWAALVAVVAWVAYLPILDHGFVWDDAAKFSRATGGMSITASVTPDYWTSLSHEPPDAGYYRPVASLAFAAIRSGCGLEPRSYHLASLLLHGLAAGLVVLLAFRLGVGHPGSAVAGLVFALHPIHTEAVAFASDLTDLLATTLILAGVLAALDRRRVLFCVLYALALGSKESAVILPVLAAIVLGSRGGGRVIREDGKTWIGATTVLLAYLAVRWNVTGGALNALAPIAWDGWYLRLSEVGRSYASGLRMLLWPSPLIADTGPAGAGIGAGFGWAFIGTGALIASFAASWPRYRDVVWKTGFAWCLVAMLPTSNLIPLPQPWAERFLLLPSVGVALAAPSVARALARWVGTRGVGLAAVIIAIMSVVQIQSRLPDWHDDGALWRSVLLEVPNNPRALHNLAVVESEAGNFESALELYDRALEIAPRMETVNIARAHLLASTGDIDAAIHSLHDYLKRTPISIAARREMATIFERSGRFGESAATYQEWSEVVPLDPRPILGRARCLVALGFDDEATRLLELARARGILPIHSERPAAGTRDLLTPSETPDYAAPAPGGTGSP